MKISHSDKVHSS